MKAEKKAIPPELEPELLRVMQGARFPRKSLRSEIDRQSLITLKNHLGDWEAVLKFFEKLRMLQEKGLFLVWDWEKFLRKADYIIAYEPEPDFPVDRIPDIQALYRYFEQHRLNPKYVFSFVIKWKKYWNFTDLTYEKVEKIVENVLKRYYNTTEHEKLPAPKQ